MNVPPKEASDARPISTGLLLHAKTALDANPRLLPAPRVSIDGAPPLKAAWGDNVYELSPGTHQVECWFGHLGVQGNRAEIWIAVREGEIARVVYSTRLTALQPGRIAADERTAVPRPQPAPGAGWHPDPTGRHDLRYWNGAIWTEHVVTGGEQSRDLGNSGKQR